MTGPWRSHISYFLFLVSVAFVIYMPLHVLIVQSFSLLSGGIEVWKAAKDVALFAGGPALLYVSWKRGLWQDTLFRRLLVLGLSYAAIHGLFLLLSREDDTYSTIVASVYNTRILGYVLLGYIVGSSKNGRMYLKWLCTAALIVAVAVALFGIAQYFLLPDDFLVQFGYTIERGVRPLFFIDDKPDLPRVMSTIKDPNSLGAYLIVPLIMAGYAAVSNTVDNTLFIRPFRRGVLAGMIVVLSGCLVLTFSRGALIATMLSTVTILYIVTGSKLHHFLKKYWIFVAVSFALAFSFFVIAKDTYLVQNLVFHADQSTVLADPNELRVQFVSQAVDDVFEKPLGYGPGTAGLVAINNPKGGVLTENYYLQIAYEVGWMGVLLFLGVLTLLAVALYSHRTDPFAAVLLVSLVGYLFYSLLIHLWSNEAIALQWWLLTGVFLGSATTTKNTLSN